MQFSVISLFAALTGIAMAMPMSLHQVRSCDVLACGAALGGTAVSCGAAAVEVGANPIADIGCLAGALNTAVNTPASCTACADQLGISSVAGDVETAVGGAVDDVTSAIGSIF